MYVNGKAQKTSALTGFKHLSIKCLLYIINDAQTYFHHPPISSYKCLLLLFYLLYFFHWGMLQWILWPHVKNIRLYSYHFVARLNSMWCILTKWKFCNCLNHCILVSFFVVVLNSTAQQAPSAHWCCSFLFYARITNVCLPAIVCV